MCTRVLCSFVLPFLILSSPLAHSLSLARSFLLVVFTSKWPWSCSNIHIYKKKSEERKEETTICTLSLLFFSIPFSRNSSLVYTHICSINGYNIPYIHTYVHTRTYIRHQEKRSKVEARTKTCSNFFLSAYVVFSALSSISRE